MTIKKQKLTNILFYFSYFLVVSSEMLTQVKYIAGYLKYFDYLAILILFVVFLIQSKNYSFKSFIYSIIFIFLSVIVTYVSKDSNILKLVLFLICFKDINFSECVKVDFYIKLLLVLLVMLLYSFNMTVNIPVYRNGVLRKAFGFKHPNKIGMYLMMICLDCIYLSKGKFNMYYSFVILIIITFLFMFVDSRTSVLIVILAISFIYINKITKSKIIENKLVKIGTSNLFLIMTLLTLLLTILTSNGNLLAVKINRVLSYRFTFNKYFLTQYHISLFGNNIITNNMYLLDSSYINILLRYGIIMWIWIYFLFFKTINKLYNDKEFVLLIIIILLMLYGFSESFLYKITANVFLLYFGKILNKEVTSCEAKVVPKI